MVRAYSLVLLGLALTGASVGACSSDMRTPRSSGEGGSGGDPASGSSSSGSGQGGSGGGGVDPAAVKAACDAFAKALCGKINECGPFLTTVLYGDLATCEARLALACPPAYAAPGVNATSKEIDACTSALAGASCDDMGSNNLPAACQLSPGDLADGAPCGDDLQCASSHCGEPMNEHCGLCSPKGAAGAACVENGDCAKGLICSGGNKTCVAPGKMGAPCDANNVCSPVYACRKGTCQAPLQQGASCDFNVQTTLPECDLGKGLYCEFFSQKCSPLKTAKGGQDCGVVGFEYILCVAGSTCSATGQSQGTCLGPIPEGGACDPAKPACLSPAQCIDSKCAIEDPATCK